MKKSIKSKILLLFAVILLVFAMTAIWSITNFVTLSNSIDNIMRANYYSVVAAQNMIVALERQDSAILSYMFTGDENALLHFKENEIEFLKWFSNAENNITEAGEKEVIQQINNKYFNFLEKFRILSNIQANKGPEEAKDYYFMEVLPLFEDTKEFSRNLQELNQVAMLNLKDKAHKTARKAIFSTLSVALVTTIVGIILAWLYTDKIVQPINVLIEKVKKVAEGDYSQRIEVTNDGEITLLAKEFNIMAEKLSIFQQFNISRLMKEKKKAEAIVESISDGIIVTDKEHKITLVNKAAEKVFSIEENNVLNNHFLEAVKYENIFAMIKDIEVIGAGKKRKGPKDIIISLKTNGETNHFRIQVLPIQHKDQEFIGAVTLIQDITKLREVDEMKSDFISTVSHEFRTPLTSISMGVGLLLEEIPGPLTNNQRELVEAMKEDEERLKNLVSDLLDLSKIESGKIEMNIIPNSVDKIIAEATRAFTKQAEEKNISLETVLQEDLPLARADYNKIVWVLINLIGNALRYTPQDASGVISVEARRAGKVLLVSVTDNGTGIPQEYRKRIFEKFIQVKDEHGHSTGGTGLGLAICKEIIDAHGGRIWVKSKLTKGSTFFFTLAIEQ